MNKPAIIVLLSVLVLIAPGSGSSAIAQPLQGQQGQQSVTDNGKFIGQWVCGRQDDAFEIYKDGSLTIVHRYNPLRKDMDDLILVANVRGNRLNYSYGKDNETLIMNDDANKIYFDGKVYTRK